MPAISQSARTPIKKPKLPFKAKAAIAAVVVVGATVMFTKWHKDTEREFREFAGPVNSAYKASHYGNDMASTKLHQFHDICQSYGFTPEDMAAFIRIERRLLGSSLAFTAPPLEGIMDTLLSNASLLDRRAPSFKEDAQAALQGNPRAAAIIGLFNELASDSTAKRVAEAARSAKRD